METVKSLGRAALRALPSFRRRDELAGAEPRPCPASEAGVLRTPLAKAHARRLISNFDLREGMRVLDVGCGIGRLSLPIARIVGDEGEIVGLDLQEEMLDELRRQALDEGLTNVATVRGAVGEPMDLGAFDLVVLSSVLGEIPADRRLPGLREIHRAMKPDGVLYVCEVALFDPDYQSREAVRALAWDAGFSLGEARTVVPGYVLELTKGRGTPP